MWNLEVSDRDKVLPVIFELADKVEPEHGIVLAQDVAAAVCARTWTRFAEIYNAAWKQELGLRRRTATKDLDAYAQEMQLVFDKHWFMVAEIKDTGEAVGIAITVPDINQVLRQDERHGCCRSAG